MLRAILYPFALLPLRLLYIFSDFLYLLVFYCLRYRRKIVEGNLRACFPEKSEKERNKISREFYRNFTDYIVETLKLLHISDREMERRFHFENLQAMTAPMDRGQSVTIYYAHTGNWEWATSVILHCKSQFEAGDVFAQIYRPLRNKAFDKLMLQLRARFNAVSIPKNTALRVFLQMRREGVVSTTGFMSDQKPGHGDPGLPLMFLHRPTAMITGTETLARRLGHAVVYWDLYKEGRGRYKIKVVAMCDNARDTAEGQITRQYAEMLEKTIRRNPPVWLWSHNRWKNPVTLPQEEKKPGLQTEI